ncbi:MAG: hypothetical protein J6K32_01850 [Clostridia bacterium]|nr:hypothetical protein [Clostridia bacterium]
MSSPLYDMMGGVQAGPMGQMQRMLQEYQQFRASYKGDPKQEVQRLLNSGQMSQEQYNQLQQAALQLQQMLR